MAITDNNVKWRVTKIGGGEDFNGYWNSQEEVRVGEVRFLRGRENSGYVLHCVEGGLTGESQPSIGQDIEIANYSALGVVGRMRMIFNIIEKDVDEVMAMGVTYSRLTYPELWSWAGKRVGLVISEEEWQAKFAETNGKFVPYYSSGDGSSTFRTPLLGAYLKGAETSSEVGKWLDAGLPNIEGASPTGLWADTEQQLYKGSLVANSAINRHGTFTSGSQNANIYNLELDASRSNSIYGNSDTVTPETMTGIWVIKAIGIVVDSGETDLANVLHAVEQVQSQMQDTINDVEVKISNINTHTVPDYSSQVKLKYNTNNTMSNDGFIRFWLHWPSDYGHDMTIVINGSTLPVQTNDNHGHDTILYPVKKGDIVKYSSSRGGEYCSAIFFKVR